MRTEISVWIGNAGVISRFGVNWLTFDVSIPVTIKNVAQIGEGVGAVFTSGGLRDALCVKVHMETKI